MFVLFGIQYILKNNKNASPPSTSEIHAITFQELAENDTIHINKLTYWQIKDLGADSDLTKLILNNKPFQCVKQLHSLNGYLKSDVHFFEPFFHLSDTCPTQNSISKKKNLPLIKEERPIELNTCTANDLIQLGTHKKTAFRLVKFRTKLGGFYSKEQLKEIYEISPSELGLLEKQKINKELIKTININNISSDCLAYHPYLLPKQAQTIINYKKVIKRYQSKDDLYKVYFLDSNDVQKLSPYLEF